MQTTMQITTQREVRRLFWESFPEFANEKRPGYSQNDYRTDIRVAFTDFIDSLYQDGSISESMVNKVTL